MADGSAIELSARVEEVENAREQVKNGVIQGVLELRHISRTNQQPADSPADVESLL